MEPDFDCEYQDEIVCPFCGYKEQDSYEVILRDGDECTETTCSSCSKRFGVTVNKSIDYSSWCLEHDYKDNPSEAHPDCILCKRCGHMQFKRFLKQITNSK